MVRIEYAKNQISDGGGLRKFFKKYFDILPYLTPS